MSRFTSLPNVKELKIRSDRRGGRRGPRRQRSPGWGRWQNDQERHVHQISEVELSSNKVTMLLITGMDDKAVGASSQC